MEQRMQMSFEEYMDRFKLDLQKKAVALNFSETEKVKELLEFLFRYPKWSSAAASTAASSSAHHFTTSSVSGNKRKSKPDSFSRGSSALTSPSSPIEVQGMYLFPTDIQGIYYFLDQHDNVYLPDDIERRIPTPRILGKLVRSDHNEIPLELGMIQVKPEFAEYFQQWSSTTHPSVSSVSVASK